MSGALTRSGVRGVAWFGITQVLNQTVRFLSLIVLARLLFPEDFGVIAMATIVTDLVISTLGLGFAAAIVQRKEVTDSHLSTAFWTGLALGIVLCIVTVLISPLVADFFENELVGPVLAVSSIAFVIAPLRNIHGALLRKRLQFFRFSIGEIGQGVTYVAVALFLAFAGFGVWSLVAGNLAGLLAIVILRWALCRWRPSFMFSVNSWKDLWRFGSNLTGTRVVNFLTDKLDYLIIGRFLAAAALGFYYMGYRIARFPSSGLDMTLGRVAFPTFSIIQGEDERLRRGFTRTLSYLSLIALPLFVGLAIIAPEAVRVVLGQNWTAAILPMQILCIMGAITSIAVTVGPLLRSKGRPDIELKINLVKLALLVPCLLIAVRFGTVGVAAGVSAVAAIMWLTRQVFANRLIGLRMRDYLASLGPAAFGCMVMAATLLTFRYAAASLLTLPDVGLLISSVLLGVVIYFVTLKATRTQALNEMTGLVLEMVKPYSKSVIAHIPLVRKQAPHVVQTGPEEPR